MTDLPVPIGTVIAGRYRVERVLGAGAMGVVAAAFHLEFEQPVAIKFVSPAALGQVDATERFRREVRAAAKIKGEHVARVLAVGALESGLPYMVMELLDGRTLEQELEARRCLPVSEAVEYVLQAIEALAEAHAAGIVHRDLKPANLFVSRRADRSRIVKVLDFGVSKSLGESESSGLCLTSTGMIVGSPLYMSPEQLGSSKTADVRSDIWAVGAILFELVSGRTPFSATSMPDLYAKLLRDVPTPISHYLGDVPPAFEAVITRCLQRDPEQRFSNVSALAEALLPFAPAAARVHAERARGVLFPSAPTQGTVESEATEAPSGKTISSWGSEVWTDKGRALVWALAATLLALGLCFAVIKLRVEGMATRVTQAASGITAASLPAALIALPSESPRSTIPSEPRVEPVEPNVKRETAAKLMRTPGTQKAVTLRRLEPKSAGPVRAPASASDTGIEMYGEHSRFGGRK